VIVLALVSKRRSRDAYPCQRALLQYYFSSWDA
jgi:hypothetical protein